MREADIYDRAHVVLAEIEGLLVGDDGLFGLEVVAEGGAVLVPEGVVFGILLDGDCEHIARRLIVLVQEVECAQNHKDDRISRF